MEEQILNEYKILPMNLEIIYTSKYFNNPFKIYSNDKIKEELIKKINDSNHITNVNLKSSIINMIHKNYIIIGYTSDKKFNFVKNKISKFINHSNQYEMGFYSPDDNKIIILLDDNVNMFGKLLSDMDRIIIHELCHMATSNNKQTKIINKTYNKILYPFYYNYFKYILIKINPKYEYYIINDLEKRFNKYLYIAINKLLKLNETDVNEFTNFKQTEKVWNEFLNNLLGPFKETKINIKEIEEIILSLYYTNYLDIPTASNNKLLISLNAIKFAYSKLKIKPVNLHPGQEFIYPSEIIAIYSESNYKILTNALIIK